MAGVKREKSLEEEALEAKWSEQAKRLLRAEMTKHGVSVDELVKRLNASGMNEKDKNNVANKIARGGFSSGFFVQCLDAIGTKTLLLGD